jgi:hypothetical protein
MALLMPSCLCGDYPNCLSVIGGLIFLPKKYHHQSKTLMHALLQRALF